MANYSITLNFFLPKKIVKALKEVKVSGNFAFDWRDSDFCHVTIKAISVCDEIPKNDILNDWIAKSQKILDRQKSFKVKIQNVAKFPTALFAGVKSVGLSNLHERLFKILPSSQPQYENDNYVPHASIGALKNDVELISRKGQNFGEFEVKEIQLVIWNLNDLNNPIICHRFRLAETP